MRRGLAAVAMAVALPAGCGAPDELSEQDGRTLAGTRERLDDALDTQQALRTSAAEARRIRREARRIVSDGSFEQTPLDEFAIARLGELREIVPSLVLTDARGQVRALDRRATAELLRFAERDAARALMRPATRQVDLMLRVLEDADAGEDTRIPVVGGDAGAYLRGAERNTRKVWPALAGRLAEARDAL